MSDVGMAAPVKTNQHTMSAMQQIRGLYGAQPFISKEERA